MGATAYPTPARGNKFTVSFGLVNVGVKYAPLVPDKSGRLSGKKLDPEMHQPVSQKWADTKGQLVTPILGYPHGEGFVVPDPSDLKALELDRDSRLELKAFVDPATVNPVYLEKAYIVWPEKGQEAGYDLLCSVLAQNGKALVGTTVISKSTKAVMLRFDGDILIAHLCAYDQNMAWNDYGLVASGRASRPAPDKSLIDMAEQILRGLPDTFDFASVTDEYDARLRAAIETLASGGKVERVAEVEQIPTSDLMEALKASVVAAREKIDAESKPKRTRKKAAA